MEKDARSSGKRFDFERKFPWFRTKGIAFHMMHFGHHANSRVPRERTDHCLCAQLRGMIMIVEHCLSVQVNEMIMITEHCLCTQFRG